MQNQATAITSQDFLTALSTAKTLLLLTTGSQFERIATEVVFDSTKSSATYTDKLPYEELSTVDILPNVAEVHLDLILANQ